MLVLIYIPNTEMVIWENGPEDCLFLKCHPNWGLFEGGRKESPTP